MDAQRELSIVWLGDPQAHGASLAGHEVALLNQLAKQQHAPPGFCLMQRKPATASIGPVVVEAVTAAYQQLAGQCCVSEVAVTIRPAFTAADGWQQAHFNVTGAVSVSAVIQPYWAVGLAVLVQPFINADVTALVHSINPATGNRGEAVIYAKWGLSERWMDGADDTDIYMVSKTNPAIYAVRVAEKVSMKVAQPGGVVRVEVPPMRRQAFALTERQISEITGLTQQAEEQIGSPLALEYAYQGERVYLISCSLIASLLNIATDLGRKEQK